MNSDIARVTIDHKTTKDTAVAECKKPPGFTNDDGIHHKVSFNCPKTEKMRNNACPNNYIKTTKYTLLTFLPINLFDQVLALSLLRLI